MKFAVSIVVMLALALGVQSSVLPWGYHGHVLAAPAHISLTHGPALVHGAPAHISLTHGPAWAPHAAVAVHAAPHASVALHAAPHHAAWAVPHHGAWAAPHHAVAVHAPVHHAHEGTYVAKTLGAVHTAPLAGHVNSASSINLEPAPGTH